MSDDREEGDHNKLEFTRILQSGQWLLTPPISYCHVGMSKIARTYSFSADVRNPDFHVKTLQISKESNFFKYLNTLCSP